MSSRIVTNQKDYLSELEAHLSSLPESERKDILRDQEEFFREALASGRSEQDVIRSLGEPKILSRSLIAESHLAATESVVSGPSAGSQPATLSKQVNSSARALFAVITLAPFNLIFVLGPSIALFACIFAAWVSGGAFLMGGFAALYMVVTELIGIGASGWATTSALSLGLSIVLFSVAFLSITMLFTTWVAQMYVKYLRWNLDMIAQR